MPKQTGSLELVVSEFGVLLEFLSQVLTPDEIHFLLLAELNVDVPIELLRSSSFSNALDQGAGAADQLPSVISELRAAIEADDVARILQRTEEAIRQIKTVLGSLEDISGQLKLLAASLSGVNAAQVDEFSKRLASRVLELLAIRYIDARVVSKEALELLGILDRTLIPADAADPSQGYFIHDQLKLGRVLDLLKSPTNHADAIYAWGRDTFAGQVFLERLKTVLSSTGLPVAVRQPTPGGPATLESFLFDLRHAIESTPPGLDLKLKVPVAAGLDLSFPLSTRFALNISSSARFDPGLTIAIRPPADISLLPLEEKIDGSLNVAIVGKDPDPNERFILLGQTGASRLEAQSIGLGFSLAAKWDDTAGKARGEFIANADITSGKVVLDTSNGDGFLSKIFSNQRLEADFQFGATWSPDSGFRFTGAAGLEIAIPVNRSLGPVDFQYLFLGLHLNHDGVPLEVSGSLSTEIGPLTATIDRMGLTAILSFPESGGNLGPIDVDIDFKPPQGIGLLIDSQGIRGGGFLRIDPPNYAGVLELSYRDQIDLTAFALITTRLPDGQPGFSLVISILAEFQPVQLGLGFALSGVGGLIGINRQFNEEALKQAFKTHALDAVLFPSNPIKDAVKLLDTLQGILPPREGYHVLGPMAKLFWGGSLRLVNFEIGIFIQLGGPLKLVLLGQAWTRLPKEETPLLVINVDVLGIIDFGEERVAFDATLYDSRIMGITLDGQMALRADWSQGEENFALSVGGFHPQFQEIPPGFPALRRLAMVMGENPRLTLTMYLAITTNTLQVGAKLELWAKKLGFTITGGASFDALFTFSPFSFLVTIKVWVNVKRGWIDLGLWLELELSGPNPIVAAGYVKIKLGWFFSVKVRFRAEFGEKVAEALPEVSPLAALKKELQHPRAVKAQLPGWASTSVAFTESGEGKVDGLADLLIVQDAVPLNFTMEKYGGGKPAGEERRLRVTTGVSGERAEQRLFAAEQFKNWTVEERLAAKPFERYDAGVSFGGEYVLPEAHREERQIVFETVLRESAEYLGSLPETDYRKVGVRTACLWQPKSVQTELLANWAQFGSVSYYRRGRTVGEENTTNYVKVKDVGYGIAGGATSDGEVMTFAEALEVAKSDTHATIVMRTRTDVISSN